MPTTRRRLHERVDVLTEGQRMHLTSGFHFFEPPEAEYPFRDEAHRRRAWALHRAAIMGEWHAEPLVGWAGRRPLAFWQYDHGLRLDEGGYRPIWPRGIRNEAQLVCKLSHTSEAELAEIKRRGMLRRDR